MPRRKRLDPHRFDGLPLAKRVRIVDEVVLERARRRGFCERCGKGLIRCDPAHIKSVKSGGDDVSDNVVALCRPCHDLNHDGKVTAEELREIVNARYRSI
jgi:RNase P subunit RPR2